MNRMLPLLAPVALLAVAASAQQDKVKEARSTLLLHQALDAQGGEQKLRALKSIQWEAAGYRNELGNLCTSSHVSF